MKMKICFTVCMAILLLAACSSPKKDRQEELRILMQDSIAKAGPQRMQVSDIKKTITYKGKDYVSAVLRRPDESLPIVKNEQGEKFVDNRITLRLTCGDRKVLDKVFTKESFASIVDASFLRHAILEGLVFDETTAQGFVYAASVCYPQTDLYIPIRITVSPDGNVTLAKDDVLDETPMDSTEEQN